MNARSLLSLLYHADKALDLVRTAGEIGVLSRLDSGPVTLGQLVPSRQCRRGVEGGECLLE